ncbi:hypothetical protein VCSRO126_3391 [Vibrio cholerae]|nr:hypothetical protein VCSRO126_3391 [Vibrio cholerae]
MNNNYEELGRSAYLYSKQLGLEPRVNFEKVIESGFIGALENLCDNQILNFLLKQFGSGYWGTQCLNIAPQVFALLHHLNIDCELVYGEVEINGTDEFDTTLSGLENELKEPGEAGFAIHVWIQIGKNLIIDPTIAARLNKYYDPNFPPHQTIIGLSEKLSTDKLIYKPMLMGAKYMLKTCGVPLQYNVNAR